MWVYCPYTPEELSVVNDSAGKPMPVTFVTWGQKKYPIKQGINEIPVEIAQAFFAAALPEELENHAKNYKLQIKVCLRRWNRREDQVDFLDAFIVTDTREQLEKILEDAKAEVAKKAEDAKTQSQAKK